MRSKAVHLALGVRADGAKEILGLWIERTEDVLIAIVDGLKGFPQAITAVFPEAPSRPVSSICSGTLAAFDAGPWGRRYPAIGQSWRRAWSEVVPFYAFPGDVPRILYTTTAIQALNAKLRRAVPTRGHFPTDAAAMKLLFLVLNRTERGWKMPPREWSMAETQFAVLFGDRFKTAMA